MEPDLSSVCRTRSTPPHYQGVLAAAHRQLSADSRAPLTQSNGICVNRVIVHRSLKPALAIAEYEPFLAAACATNPRGT